jgi:NAD(P)-dependent dehydrogenase (short-subunit alcohol dehydrogenase family)
MIERREVEVNLADRVAVVTGGTAGIGLQIAETFARAGAKIAICGRNKAKVDRAVTYLQKKKLKVFGEAVDVSQRASIFDLADNVEKAFGGIDIWVSNAGVYPQKKLIETTEAEWQMVMDINMKSVYYGGLIAADKLKKRGGGVLFNAASFASLMPSVGSGAYAASKAAVYSMTKSLAAELAPHNIRVIGYIPGVIKTEMTAPLTQTSKELLESQIALHRLGESREVANALLFLATEHASYITGTFIEISGGKFCVQNPQNAWR